MPSHLTQRAGIFYFRARVPTHLVEAFGRSIVSLSLGTRDPAEARRRARERRVEFERALAQLEPAAPARSEDRRGSVLHLSDADIEALCERYRAQRLLEDEQQRMQGLSAGAHELDLDLLEIALPRLRSAYARGDLSDVHADLKRFLDAIGLKVSRSSPSYERLARRFQQVDLELHEALLKRRSGVPVDVKLPRFHGHLSLQLREGVRDAQDPTAIPGGVQTTDAGAGGRWPHACPAVA